MLVVLGDDDRLGLEQPRLRQESQHLLVRAMGIIGRVEEDNIAAHGLRIEQAQREDDLALQQFHPCFDRKRLQVVADGPRSLAVGLGKTKDLAISGEGKEGVLDALHFIEKVKTRNWKAVPIGKTVAVIGAGNTAIDAVTQAKRLGAQRVMLVYRRTEKDAPAYDYEIELGRKDGIEFLWQSTPLEILGNGRVTGLKCKKSDGTEFKVACEMVILAIGQQKQVEFLQQLGLELDEKGRVSVGDNMQTSHPKIFAGGDCVNGGAEAVDAAQMGKKAASGIHFSLFGEETRFAGS